jgi:DNA-binding CsgD family transcriptional regulator
VTLLDEVMVAMEVEELSPVVVGDLYCGVIGGCMEVFDLRRAQEWTAALGRWCDGQPDLVAYRGECLIRRAQLLQLGGAWQDALDEARRACSRLSDPSGQSGVGAAHYQRAELHRLRGELAEAEEGYRAASRRGTKPQPGLALLRLAQGRTAAAAAAVSLAVTEAPERRKRARLLPACVEISLAVGDAPSARAAAEELSELAMEWNAPYLRAVSAHAIGAVRLAEGDAAGALAELRQACSEWQRLDAPYEGARTRVLIGIAYRTLGDQDGAALELDAARAVFEGLGATGDVARVDELTSGDAPEPKDGLTPRERQVLSRVAAGETNRRIATGLGISERTVERHVSNILAKLQVASRTAAAAYAHRHHLT